MTTCYRKAGCSGDGYKWKCIPKDRIFHDGSGFCKNCTVRNYPDCVKEYKENLEDLKKQREKKLKELSDLDLLIIVKDVKLQIF